MSTFNVDAKDFAKFFLEVELKRLNRVAGSINEQTKAVAEEIIKSAPEDLGAIKRSVHSESLRGVSRVIVDAPHAAAVEFGSRPHTPPLKPLLGWVKRHLHLFGPENKASRIYKRSPHLQAARSASISGKSAATRGPKKSATLSDKRVYQIARGIQMKIAKDGTKPTWFVRKATERARGQFASIVRKRIQDP